MDGSLRTIEEFTSKFINVKKRMPNNKNHDIIYYK